MTDLLFRTSDGFAAALLAQLPSAVIVTDAEGIIVCWNQLAETLYGYPATHVLGTPLSGLGIGPADKEENRAIIQHVLADGEWSGEYETRRADGSRIRVAVSCTAIILPEWNFTGFMGVSVDVGARADLDERLAYDALHDSLTGLPNRRLFIDHLDNALARNARSGELTAVVVVDLDDFRGVNDRLGHDAADLMLQRVAEVLGGEMRTGDVVARLGGDEFLVCCDEVSTREAALQLAERIARSVRMPLDLGEAGSATVSASIGVAVAAQAVGSEATMRNAYAAMYTAKSAGGGAIVVFDDVAQQANRLRHDQVRELRSALDAGEIDTYFQPQVNLTTGQLVGFEALARWTHAERGPISPADFIAAAEGGGLIDQLGLHVLLTSCRAAAQWNQGSEEDIHIAVNVSAHQLADPGFPDIVRGIIRDTGIPARILCLELTESALVDTDVASLAFARLKAVGVDLAIDDFGTGFSSLSRLHRFPLDCIKVDHGFVKGMMDRSEDAIIVSAVLGLARALGLRTVGEGIEDVAQLEQLRAMGCDVGQGYLWSPAVPASEALRMVRAPLDLGPTAEATDRPAVIPAVEWSRGANVIDPCRAAHRLQLYERDESIVTAVVDEFEAAASNGHAMVLVATEAHRAAVASELRRRGVVLDQDAFHALDADRTLGALLVDDEPDTAMFAAKIGVLVRYLAKRWPGVSIYGEMVGLLWERGQAVSAMQLEELWNGLAEEVDFTLLCGYRLSDAMSPSDYADVCELHTGVRSSAVARPAGLSV